MSADDSVPMDLSEAVDTQHEESAGPSSKKRKNAINLDKNQQSLLIDACATFSAIDMRPFDFVEKDGFAELATTIFNLGTLLYKIISKIK